MAGIIEIGKKILMSKWLRLILSVGLIYLAFRNIDVGALIRELMSVPWWFVVAMCIYTPVVMLIGGARWALVALGHIGWKDVLVFTKSVFIGSFYNLLFPSAVGGDALKWLKLIDKYPQLSKAKLASSVLIDRIVGLTAFVMAAVIAIVVAKIIDFPVPDYLCWLFSGLLVMGIVGYACLYVVDLRKIFGRVKWLNRPLQMVEIFRQSSRRGILLAIGLSLLAEPVWMLPTWFYSQIFGAGMSLLSVYVYLPIISLILVLPISVAGFGAREQLYLYFFGQLGLDPTKILAVSTFGGIWGILSSVIGGVFLMF